MLSIIAEINRQRMELKRVHNLDAAIVYMGREEYNLLRQEVEAACFLKFNGHRLEEVLGIPIQVDERMIGVRVQPNGERKKSMTRDQLLTAIFTAHGQADQIEQMEEECAEVIVAAQHFKRGRADMPAVLSEIVDVYLLARQFQNRYPLEFNLVFQEKVEREAKRLGLPF